MIFFFGHTILYNIVISPFVHFDGAQSSSILSRFLSMFYARVLNEAAAAGCGQYYNTLCALSGKKKKKTCGPSNQ